MKYAAIFCLMPTVALAGGYAEPIYPPELIRPEPRPTTLECHPLLWWTICETENPSPGREREDPPAPEKPAKPDPRPEPPAVSEPPQQPPEPPVSEPPKVEPPKDTPPATKPPGKPEKPKRDKPPRNPGNDKPVGKSPYDGERGEVPKGKHHDRRD